MGEGVGIHCEWIGGLGGVRGLGFGLRNLRPLIALGTWVGRKERWVGHVAIGVHTQVL